MTAQNSMDKVREKLRVIRARTLRHLARYDQIVSAVEARVEREGTGFFIPTDDSRNLSALDDLRTTLIYMIRSHPTTEPIKEQAQSLIPRVNNLLMHGGGYSF